MDLFYNRHFDRVVEKAQLSLKTSSMSPLYSNVLYYFRLCFDFSAISKCPPFKKAYSDAISLGL